LEPEVGGEAVQIATNSLAQVLRRDAIEAGQIPVEHDLLAANLVNQLVETFDGN
jgi:hypothetical protein